MLCLPQVQEFLDSILARKQFDAGSGGTAGFALPRRAEMGNGSLLQPVLAVRCGEGNRDVPIGHCRTDCAPTSGSGLAFDVLGRRLDPISGPG